MTLQCYDFVPPYLQNGLKTLETSSYTYMGEQSSIKVDLVEIER